jgi:hypothetical protein
MVVVKRLCQACMLPPDSPHRRRLNVLMSRPRSSLIIIGGGAALLGRGWAGQERASPLTVLENPLEVDGLINRLGTHTLNFRAFANSAGKCGFQ